MDLQKYVSYFLEILFPIYCCNCKKSGILLCQECRAKLKTVEQICIGCQKPSKSGKTHSLCLKKNKYLPDSLFCMFDYKNSIAASIVQACKYEMLVDYAGVMAELSQEFTKIFTFTGTELTTFVPMHKYKLNLRGFNQSEIYTARLFSTIPVNLLNKIKVTKNQIELNREQRELNLKESFACIEDPQDQSIILVDDVTTTGSTLKECTKVLKENGAKQVFCLTFARD